MAKKTNADGIPKRQRSGRLGDRNKVWRTVSGSVAANAAELPQAAIPLAALDKILAEVDQIFLDQAAFRASKQLSSKRLATLFEQGDKLTTVLKVLVKQHYGNGSDKLVEFGVQPLRVRPKATVVPPETPAPTPAATSPSIK
ncbi:MAG TPA: hypothetical protein VGS07_32155 [Thermoanaerobaculia bacterium]|jgi:hypothetical protein|nr:hypothetical protein [Thermoanaerobaculia bacterium]